MLVAFGVHGGFGLKIKVNGDLQVDTHHTVEDTGIALGRAFKEALGDMSGIERYGSFSIPMDEALANCVLDISNRPFLVFNANFEQEKLRRLLKNCMTEEFFPEPCNEMQVSRFILMYLTVLILIIRLRQYSKLWLTHLKLP